MTETARRGLYVQYGCGLCAPDGWMNFDASPRLRFERIPGVSTLAGTVGKRLFPSNISYGDIVFGLPLADGSADAVYASHVLEHLSRKDVTRALANTLRVLKPSGVFRMIVPDLEWRAERYLQDKQKGGLHSADDFINDCSIGETEHLRGACAAAVGLRQQQAHVDVRLGADVPPADGSRLCRHSPVRFPRQQRSHVREGGGPRTLLRFRRARAGNAGSQAVRQSACLWPVRRSCMMLRIISKSASAP